MRASSQSYEKLQGAAFRLNRPNQSWLGAVGTILVVGIAYFLAARVGVVLGVSQGVPIFWPAAGIAVGAFIALGPNARLPVTVAMVAAMIVSGILSGRSLSLTLTFAFFNTGEALLTAWLIERWFGPTFSLGTVRQVLGFVVATAVSEAIAASGAGSVVHYLEPATSSTHAWRLWFASCSLGIFTVAPLIIGLAEIVREPPPRRELIEGTVGLATLAVLSIFVISLPQSPWATALPVALVLPVLLWIAVRCRPAFAAAAMFIVALAVFWSTTFDAGQFADASVPLADRILAAQTLVLAAALLALILAALFAERRHSEAAFRTLLGSLPAAIHTTDTSGRITYCNKAAVDLWGVSPELGKDKCSDLGRLYYPDGTLMPVDICPTKLCLTEGRAIPGREALFERPDGRRIPIIPYPAPLLDESGSVVGVVSMKLDITERKKAEAALADRNAQLALARKVALVGGHTYDCAAGITALSPGSAAIYGLPEDTAELSREESRALVHPNDLGRLEAQFQCALEEQRREFVTEFRIRRADNSEVRWIESRSTVSYDAAGRPLRLAGVSIDVTERKRSQDHQTLLISELDHRVKNVLACVTAIAQHASESSGSKDDFLDALNGRLGSLANTHMLLSQSRWKGVDLAELVHMELAPCASSDNTLIHGPSLRVCAEAAQTVAMVLHELATNAAKYGALSNCSGQISVRWRWQSNGGEHPALTLEWREKGGPSVRTAKACGHGSSVIRDLIPYELGGTVDYVFAPEGVRCELGIPAQWVSTGTPQHTVLNGADEQPHQAPWSIQSH